MAYKLGFNNRILKLQRVINIQIKITNRWKKYMMIGLIQFNKIIKKFKIEFQILTSSRNKIFQMSMSSMIILKDQCKLKSEKFSTEINCKKNN